MFPYRYVPQMMCDLCNLPWDTTPPPTMREDLPREKARAVSKEWRDEAGDLDRGQSLEHIFFHPKGKGTPLQYLYPS